MAATEGESAGQSESAASPRLRRLDGVLHGVFALAGVVIGVLITAGITYLGDRAHRIADQRTASRLVSSEIRGDTVRLLYVAENGKVGEAGGPTTVAWSSQAPTLARWATGRQWTALDNFYTQVEIILPSLSKPVSETKVYAKQDVCFGIAALRALKAKVPVVPQSILQSCASAPA